MVTPGSRKEPFQRLSVDQAKEKIDKGGNNIMIVDVRQPEEFAVQRVSGSVLIPVGSLLARINELDRGKELIFICSVGQRSALAAEMAAAMGYTKLYNIEGGTDAWAKRGYPLEKGGPEPKR